MSEILCRWLNSELRLSKVVEPCSLRKDFANGYLIGEVLNKYQLQDDFDQFSKQCTANAKLNNFTRIEPTLQLLGVPFDLGMARAVMLGQQGAASRLLYQLYILLQKKKRAGITGTAMEAMQPAATARLHRVENEIYTERLRTVVRREADLQIQRIALRYDKRGQEMLNRSVMAELLEEQKRQKTLEELRLRDIEKHREARRRQLEIMASIQSAAVQLPKLPPNRTLGALQKQQQNRKQQEALTVHQDIAQFEKNRKKLSPAASGASSFGTFPPHTLSDEELAQANSDYVLKIRQRLEEDASAREQREKRRSRVLLEQLKAHGAQEEALREEQLVERLLRQAQQERRIAVQLMQVRRQKEVLRQGRVFRERQYQEQRLRDFQEALDREAALARQASLEHAEEKRKELELHHKITAERAQQRHRKHFDTCRGILDQIVDLATKTGEYRLLSANLIPAKLMREWKELFLSGNPLLEVATVDPQPEEPTPEQLIELEKREILNSQDYEEYVSMIGDWAWPEEGETRVPPGNNYILGHVMMRLQGIVNPPKASSPRPMFPPFPLRACVLGKLFSGKSTCLSRIAHVHGIHVLSASMLIQEALAAYLEGEVATQEDLTDSELILEGNVSLSKDADKVENQGETKMESHSSLDSGVLAQDPQQPGKGKEDDKTKVNTHSLTLHVAKLLLCNEHHVNEKLSARAQHGAAVERILRKGRAVPDELLVDIVVDAIRKVPANSGWILDGFPVDIAQAKLLEKALTGSDPDKGVGRRKWSRTANLAFAKNAPKEAPPPGPALDLVVLLDISDNLVLERAAKRAVEVDQVGDGASAPADQGGPADQGSPTAQNSSSQILPPVDKQLEKKQIQHRITGFQDTWPKLKKWFSDKQNILVQVMADVDEDTLFKRVEAALCKVMRTAEKGEEAAEVPGRIADVSTSSCPEVPQLASDSLPIGSQSCAALSVKHSRTQSTTNSPTASRSCLDAAKGKKTATSAGKEAGRKLSKSDPGRSGAPGQERSRTMSVSNLSGVTHDEGNTSAELCTSTPGQPNWEYVDEPLPKEIPEHLVPYWENVCSIYVVGVKMVMQNLRSERNLIIHHLFNIREEFRQYLRRPDLKQELVGQWQQEYNSIPDDMRHDEETKEELHQRLNVLRERLWDICERRREEAQQELQRVTRDGWLEDHMAILINHFSSLMQVEVDRFQDSLHVLRDYYSGMYKAVLPEAPTEFTCIPLLDIAEMEDTNQSERPKSSSGSAPSKRLPKSAGKKEPDTEEKNKTKVVPLIPWRPASTKVSSAKLRSPPDTDPDEKLLQDIYQTALSAINSTVALEVQQREMEESEEQQAERERMQRASQASAPPSSAKNKKKEKGKKKAPPSPVPSPPPPVEVDEEVVRALALRERIRQEHAAAREHEDGAVKLRLELIQARALATVRSLQRRAEEAHGSLEEGLGKRYLDEMSSAEQLVEVVQGHIEAAAQVKHELVLQCTDFFLDGDTRVVASPPPAPRPPPLESPADSTLTIIQLGALFSQFRNVAPSGLMNSNELSEILQELTSLSFGSDTLPDAWLHISDSQILEMVAMLTQHSGMLDWRQFLLSAAMPWPLPSLSQLLHTLARFRTVDPTHTGFITEGLYLQVELWFPSETSLPIPEDPSEPLPYDRLANLRKFFFTLFAEPGSSVPRLDYVRMLLYLSSHPEPRHGFIRALSVAMGYALHLRSFSPLLKSVPYMEDSVCAEAEAAEEQVDPAVSEGEEGVSIEALLSVLSHGAPQGSAHCRLHSTWRSPQENKEDFVKIFKELGFSEAEKVPLTLLSQYPLLQDLMEGSTQYRLADIHRVLQRGEPLGSPP